jgi:hypothetical protein
MLFHVYLKIIEAKDVSLPSTSTTSTLLETTIYILFCVSTTTTTTIYYYLPIHFLVTTITILARLI